MANTQSNPKYIREVSVINNQGTIQVPKVAIAPDATHVIVRKANAPTNKASLQDFLFKMFEVQNGQWAVKTDAQGDPQYYEINPSQHSIWQGWTDYQDIIQKRLIGLYEDKGNGTYEYLGNFLLGLEPKTDIQANMTLTDTNNDVEENIGQVIRLYQLGNRDNGDADYRIPLDYFKNLGTDEVVNVEWDDFTDDEAYTPADKAKELMLQFGEKSFWQALTDNQIELKDKLIGIYKDGRCIGHFEPTRYNLDVIKEIYGEGFVISETAVDGKVSKLIYKGVNNDKDALNLMLDLEKKSIYQQLIELKDFWITLPFEEYNNTASGGNDIANKYDIGQLHFVD